MRGLGRGLTSSCSISLVGRVLVEWLAPNERRFGLLSLIFGFFASISTGGSISLCWKALATPSNG